MSISRNVVWSTCAAIVPIVVGVVVVPLIIARLGVERFGVLSGVWMLIGYFTICDFGLGRTLTKFVAERLQPGREHEIPSLVATTLGIVAASGLLLSVTLALAAKSIASSVADTSPALITETTGAILWLAVGLPFVLLTTILSGLLEAYQKFALLGAIRVPMGILTFALPLAVLPFSRDIAIITAALAFLRIANATIILIASLRVVPALHGKLLQFSREHVRPLLSYGGWLTLSNIVAPVLVYFDRFLIGSLLGTAAIAYYTVPYDMLTRLWVFPLALQGVLFPALVSMRSEGSARLIPTIERSSETTLLLLAPALLATMLLGREGLDLWVGAAFAENSSTTAAILVVGVLINSLARTPFALVQSAGHASWTAMVHVLELPLYAAVLWWALNGYGIDGAAYAWTARISFDAVVFYALAIRLEPRLLRVAIQDLLLVAGLCAIAIVMRHTLHDLLVRMSVVIVFGAACGVLLLRRLKGVFLPARQAASVEPVAVESSSGRAG
jgi:O-antigen/teichoic acid export membrane protein